ncbi:MAG: type II toxin-antitoxin system VapC family toxin [Coriobacteriia bacterium]|nr:type II toxin-antitoxin system VapC family toxin [Coriobacteriia bacterium]
MHSDRSQPVRVVPDASVLVKTFRPEQGSEEAVSMLDMSGRGEIILVLPALALEEALNVARRELGVPEARVVWTAFLETESPVIGIDDVVVQTALDVCELYGCTFYDAVAPAVAQLAGATLWSGDRRAHGRIPGVVLVG